MICELMKKTKITVENWSELAEVSGVEEIAKVFLELEPNIRTFKGSKSENLSAQERIETSSPNMSSAKRSGTRSASKNPVKFQLEDVESMLSSRSSGKKPASSLPPSVRQKVSAKRKREDEAEKDLKTLEDNFLENATEVFSTIRAMQTNIQARHEAAIKEFKSVLSLKDALITQLTVEKSNLGDELRIVNLQAQQRIHEATEDAKIWAGRAILEAMIKIVEEAMDPAFDRATWDLEGWKKTLAELKEDEEVDEVEGGKDEAETSRAKDSGGKGTSEEEAVAVE